MTSVESIDLAYCAGLHRGMKISSVVADITAAIFRMNEPSSYEKIIM